MNDNTTESVEVLVVDDDPFVREMICDILDENSYQTRQAEHGRQALDILQETGSIGLIITDVHMPVMSGIELVEQVRRSDTGIPIIILTVNSELSTAIDAIRKGADDYILKGSTIGDTLPLSVVKVLELYDLKAENRRLFEDLSRKNAELERLAFIDGLTGVANRRYYDLTLNSLWHTARRNHQPISMIMTDIDRFKELNDTLGHQYGDLCIRSVARTLDSLLKKTDTIFARFGGDEFAAILPQTASDEAAAIAEQMRVRIEELRVTDPETGRSKDFTMSFGIFGLTPEFGSQPEMLLEGADAALYDAKHSGRNTVIVRDL